MSGEPTHPPVRGDADDVSALPERLARRMATAYDIIQAIHGDISIDNVTTTIVENLVDAGGFVSSTMVFKMTIGEQRIEKVATAGLAEASDMLSRTTPIFIRGQEVGSLRVSCDREERRQEQFELLEWIFPILVMSLDNAVSFAEVSDYRQALERRVAERTSELAQAVTELQEAQAVRSRIFANINHEIRTPLSLVMLGAAEIRGRYQNKQDVKTMTSIANIEAASERLLNMVDSMLLLAAGQEGKLRVRIRLSDIAAEVRRAVSIWLPHARSNHLSLTYTGPDSLNGDVDTVALERVLANLISNAIKYTPDGGSVEVGLDADDDEVRVSVRDTGVGIDDEFRKRIFGRFEQGRAAVRKGSRSSGIGLAIVKELVEAHHGQVTVDNASGGGSIFTVRFPRAASQILEDDMAGSVVPQHSMPIGFGVETHAEPLPRILDPEGTSRATLLVAEDDNGLRGSIGELLVNAGYRVLLAADGFSAIQLASEQFPDMLVSDVGMPGMDGLELSRRFRDLPGNRLAPVLLLTAYGTMSDKLLGFQSGAIDYVTKPFEPKELVARVESQLKIREMALRLGQSEKLASLGTLSAGLAHEMRNPANGLLNALDPLYGLLPPEVLDPESGTGQLLDVIRDCAQQVARLSKQLLSFKSDGSFVCVDENVQLLVKRALSMVDAKRGGVSVRTRFLYGDKLCCAGAMLLQVLVNLLDNAVQAAGTDGWVEIVTRLDGDQVVFEISDSGSGVPPELRERIFEPFFTTKAPGVGTGLGLSTSRQIVEQHRGTVRVVDGATSTFRVSLPLNGPDVVLLNAATSTSERVKAGDIPDAPTYGSSTLL